MRGLGNGFQKSRVSEVINKVKYCESARKLKLSLFSSKKSEDSNRWVARTPGSVAKIQKKRKSIEKSYLDVLYGSRNTRNRSSMLEILLLAPKNIIKLHLSFEIDQFEVGGA